MKLYKVDTSAWTVVPIEGEPWPGKDAAGDVCYENTHFAEEERAWEKLEREALAFVEIAGRNVVAARAELRQREGQAADAAVALESVRSARRRLKQA